MPSGRPSRALRSRPIRLSIHVKLIGLISVMMTAIVGFLTIYFPARQSATIHAGLSARARSYGAMLATQARSAVAFSDRETAREILSPLDDDPYVASIALFDDHGETLYAHGSPSDWVERAKLGVVSPRLFALNGRVAFVAPV
ncbi:MAG TPA: CHASE sensor domain-containing protein, partial [Kofleriaceae bacterium]|nr:CHASE sensor domain-containing protein [Kofleriaceae bacterium]